MAYSEGSIGGSSGGYFKVWVRSVRSYNGSASENYERWRVEGGINRVSSSGDRVWNLTNQARRTIKLGLNGVTNSGNFSYDFSTSTGTKVSWSSGTTTVYRNSAGQGFGFTSRIDVNLDNFPYLTTGAAAAGDSVSTKYRQATLTSAPHFNDEQNPTISYSNPAGSAVSSLQASIHDTGGSSALVPYRNVSQTGSSYTFNLSEPERDALRNHLKTSNSKSIRFYLRTVIGGSTYYSYATRTLTIIDNIPTFENFEFEDTNSTTAGITGDDQVLIQGKSTLQATVPVEDKAISKKMADMNFYTFTLGGYSQNSPWSDNSDVIHALGPISDVTGTQSLSVRAVDSRGNGQTVSKNIDILPYENPRFVASLGVDYTNSFDRADGLTVTSENSKIAEISPLTLNGNDKNAVNPTSGVQFDMSKGDNESYTGVWENVASSLELGTGAVTVNITQLESDILTKMMSLTSNNTVKWFVKFKITDNIETVYRELSIDIGRPIFRIGSDAKLYYNEIEFYQAFSPTNSIFLYPVQARAVTGTWVPDATFNPSTTGPYTTTSKNVGDAVEHTVFLSEGTYDLLFDYRKASNRAIISLSYAGGPVTSFQNLATLDLYTQYFSDPTMYTVSNIEITESNQYAFRFTITGKNSASSDRAYELMPIVIKKHNPENVYPPAPI